MSITIRITTAPRRKKPKAGDEKVVKGVTMIRQQQRLYGMSVVSNGRPVWEWVEKGSERGRSARRK
jgi:hypothetical protein